MKKFLLTRLGRDSFIHKPITRNLSFQNNWDGSHILYRKKTIPENVQFIQEKYFEFSWNLAKPTKRLKLAECLKIQMSAIIVAISP